MGDLLRGANPLEAAMIFVIAIVMFVVIFAASAAVFAYPLAWAWNGVVPTVFGLPKIGWDEAFAAQWLFLFVRGAPIRVRRD